MERRSLPAPVLQEDGTYAVTCPTGHVFTVPTTRAEEYSTARCTAFGPDWTCGKIAQFFLPRPCRVDVVVLSGRQGANCDCGWSSPTLFNTVWNDRSAIDALVAEHLKEN